MTVLWNMNILNLKTVAGYGWLEFLSFSEWHLTGQAVQNPILYNNDYLFLMTFTWEFRVRMCAIVCERTQE